MHISPQVRSCSLITFEMLTANPETSNQKDKTSVYSKQSSKAFALKLMKLESYCSKFLSRPWVCCLTWGLNFP